MENLGAFEDIRNLRFERRLPVGAEALWPYLADAERTAVWRSRCELQPRVGGDVLVEGAVPAHGSVTAWSPGERLAFAVPGFPDPEEDRQEIAYTLAPDGGATTLTVTHRLPRGWVGGWLAGEWHASLDALTLAVDGGDVEAIEAARKPSEALVKAYDGAFHDARARQPLRHMKDIFAVTPFHAALGLELVEISRDKLVGRLPAKRGLTLPGGRMHGGAVAAAIDAIAGYHGAMAAEQRATETGGERGRGFSIATTGLTVDYLRSLRAESYSITTTLLHAGANLIRIRAEMVDDDGPVAVATATFTC
ncbi:MAG TPA: SRPBCC domain-containing protein [Caulobacteraceae bacterium]|nr:SRPBCC domain-containing protein [Caulobacteraceae bacterium]